MTSDRSSALAQLIVEIKRNRPEVYRELRGRYVESILAIEQGLIRSFDDNTDPDSEDQLPALRGDLIRLGILRG